MSWQTWFLFWFLIIFFAIIAGRPSGDYDMSPVYGAFIIMLGLIFTAGYFIAKFLG
jgi:hypothetical protein